MAEEKKKVSRHNIQLDNETFEKLNALQTKLKEAFKTRYTKSEVVYALIEYFKHNVDTEEFIKFKKFLDEAKLKGKAEKQQDLTSIIEDLKKL